MVEGRDRECFPEDDTLKLRPNKREVASQVNSWGRCVSGGGYCMCKGHEAGWSLVDAETECKA